MSGSHPKYRRSASLREGLHPSNTNLSIQPTSLFNSGAGGGEPQHVNQKTLRQLNSSWVVNTATPSAAKPLQRPRIGSGRLADFSQATPTTIGGSPVAPSVSARAGQRSVSAGAHVKKLTNGLAVLDVTPPTPTTSTIAGGESDEGYRFSYARGAASPMGSRGSSAGLATANERVVIQESRSHPNVPVVYRSHEDRTSNPDRLSLDRRGLQVCPVLEGEENLRLLNYQHNMISKIQHLSSLKHLIFLDLYDNQIQQISGLSSLRSLRVLMLGKNNISKIEGLDFVSKLDVLDLHGNTIEYIENLDHLSELRVLNLAGNLIRKVINLAGLVALSEINLRRNRIRTVCDVDKLQCLQRLFLSFNELSGWSDISALSECPNLAELTLDGNPLSKDTSYKTLVVGNIRSLKQLDMRRISDEEKRVASTAWKKEQERRRDSAKAAVMKERRQIAIGRARAEWEAMQAGGGSYRGNRVVRMPDICATHVANVPYVTSSSVRTPSPGNVSSIDETTSRSVSIADDGATGASPRCSSGTAHDSGIAGAGSRSDESVPPRKVSGTTDDDIVICSDNEARLIEFSSDQLLLCGLLSLDALNKQWGLQVAGNVRTITFRFIEFDEIARCLPKVKARFPTVQHVVFDNVNLRNFEQINALASLRRLDHLTVEEAGNPLRQFALWRFYAVYRLSVLQLKEINDEPISLGDTATAERYFGSIGNRLGHQHCCAQVLTSIDDSLRKLPSPVTKANQNATVEQAMKSALMYSPPRAPVDVKLRTAEIYMNRLATDAMLNNDKMVTFSRLQRRILRQLTEEAVNCVTLRDMSCTDDTRAPRDNL